MVVRARIPTAVNESAPSRRAAPAFSEAAAWQPVGVGWRLLHGRTGDSGFCVEWHDFATARDFNWAQSFHPEGVEICLNLSGGAEVRADAATLTLGDSTAGFYGQNDSRLTAVRRGGERHQFVTIEFSLAFLAHHLPLAGNGVHPCLRALLANDPATHATVSAPVRLTSEHRHMALSLRQPPVPAAAQQTWYHAKALEVAAALLFRPLPEDGLFCHRLQRLNRDRVQKVVVLLRENLAEPLSLDELGRRVGCSPFHLSRIFSQEAGKTIAAQLRDLRMERAAELLREGRANVTEAAVAVGYSSLSHFTVAFRDAFGCCPGLFPLRTATQAAAKPHSPRA